MTVRLKEIAKDRRRADNERFPETLKRIEKQLRAAENEPLSVLFRNARDKRKAQIEARIKYREFYYAEHAAMSGLPVFPYRQRVALDAPGARMTELRAKAEMYKDEAVLLQTFEKGTERPGVIHGWFIEGQDRDPHCGDGIVEDDHCFGKLFHPFCALAMAAESYEHLIEQKYTDGTWTASMIEKDGNDWEFAELLTAGNWRMERENDDGTWARMEEGLNPPQPSVLGRLGNTSTSLLTLVRQVPSVKYVNSWVKRRSVPMMYVMSHHWDTVPPADQAEIATTCRVLVGDRLLSDVTWRDLPEQMQEDL